jgi:hexokinase
MYIQVSRIAKWQPNGVSPDTHTAINTEWGRYSSNVLPRVQEDLDLDAETGNLKGA